MIAVPIRDAWPILTEQEREKLAAWRREGGMAAAALRLDLEHLAQQAAEAVELAAKLRDPGAAQAARNIVQSFVRLDALLDVLAGFEARMHAAEKTRRPPTNPRPAKRRAGPTHPHFHAAISAVKACFDLTADLASVPNEPLYELGMALADIEGARQPELLRFAPVAERKDGSALRSAEAKARVYAVLAMEMRREARKAGGGNTPSEDAAAVAEALGNFKRTPTQVTKWREKFAADLRAVVGGREQEHAFKLKEGEALRTLRMFAARYFAPASSRRPSSAPEWMRLAETMEARLRRMTGASPPSGPPARERRGSKPAV